MSFLELLERVDLLMAQNRYQDAETQLRELLREFPHHGGLLMRMADVCRHQDKIEEAMIFADRAIAAEPDNAVAYYIKAHVELRRNRLGEAESLIQRSIALDPYDSDYFALMAHIRLHQKRYEEALKQADEALRLDPEDSLGLNVRSQALIKLNRKAEAFQTVEGALNNDPNNAYTHANYGWSLLETGDHRKAQEHFKQALQVDPTMGYAQSGMSESIKAQNLFYRLFLRYSFFIGKLDARYQWGVVIGYWLLLRLLSKLASSYPDFQPFLIPVLVLLSLVALSTWLMTPIGNLFLRFHPYGIYLLDRNERRSANLVAAGMLLALTAIPLWLVSDTDGPLMLLIFGLSMMIPLSLLFMPMKYPWLIPLLTGICALIGIAAVVMAFAGMAYEQLIGGYVLLLLGIQFAANNAAIRQDNPD